jgi:hypothetical protein
MSNRSQVDGNVASFQALDATTVYVLGKDGNLWRENGSMSNRSQVDGNVASFQALDATTVYVLSKDGTLWQETGDMHTRSQVDGNVLQFQALSTNLIYVLGTNGTLWRELGNMNNRNEVDANLMGFTAPSSPSSSLTFNSNVTFSDSTPIGGWVNLTLSQDGTYTYSGHLHDSGFPDYNVALAVGVCDNRNNIYTFQSQGQVQGTIQGFNVNRDWDFSQTGSNSAIAEAWSNFSAQPLWKWTVDSSWNWQTIMSSLVTGIEDAAGVVGTVVSIVALAAA